VVAEARARAPAMDGRARRRDAEGAAAVVEDRAIEIAAKSEDRHRLARVIRVGDRQGDVRPGSEGHGNVAVRIDHRDPVAAHEAKGAVG